MTSVKYVVGYVSEVMIDGNGSGVLVLQSER